MKRDLMIMGGMMATLAMAGSASVDLLAEDAGEYTKPQKNPKTRRTASIALPKQERKEKSASLTRMLGRKGRA